jgi:hypothetical protein
LSRVLHLLAVEAAVELVFDDRRPVQERVVPVEALDALHLDEQGVLEGELRLGLHLRADLDRLGVALLVLAVGVLVAGPAADDDVDRCVDVPVGPARPRALHDPPVGTLHGPARDEGTALRSRQVLQALVHVAHVAVDHLAPDVGGRVDDDDRALAEALLGELHQVRERPALESSRGAAGPALDQRAHVPDA